MEIEAKSQETFYKLIGVKITNARKSQKWSQSDFATKLRLSRSSVVNIELGRQHTPPYTLWQISQLLSMPIQEFFPTRQEIDLINSNPNYIETFKEIPMDNEKQKSLTDFLNNL